MSRLQMTMDRSATEQQKLEVSLNEHRSIVAPIRRIPSEMLCEIFLYCLEDRSDYRAVEKAPFQLSFVCNKWRRVVISTPQLWSYIFIRRGPIVMEILQTWLLRSGTSPLTLIYELDDYENFYCYDYYIDAIIPHSHRWKVVEFVMIAEGYKFLEDRFTDIKGNLPMLERLRLRSLGAYPEPMTVFETAPRLHALELTKMKPTLCLFPWHQLKHCHIRRFPIVQFPHMLRQCTNLTHCTLDDPDVHVTIPGTSMTPLVHSQLQSMTLNWHGAYDPRLLFNNLVLPALRNLEIHFVYGGTQLTQTYLSSFLNRSSCNLQRLGVRGIRWTSDEFITFLQGLPSLVELTMSENLVTDQLLRQMTAGSSSQPRSHLLVPNLKSFIIEGYCFETEAIFDMVRSRMGSLGLLRRSSSVDEGLYPVETLEFISLSFIQMLEPETIAQIESLREGGLEVWVNVIGRW
jgi:hypothetical protein